MADIRGVEDRAVQRYIQELEAVGLITREARKGKTNIYWIEDISEQEAHRYEEMLLWGDKNVSPGATNMSPKVIRREEILHDVDEANATFSSKTWKAPSETEQEVLVHEMLSVLRDSESEGYYHRLAATVPKHIIQEALSLVKRAIHERKIRKTAVAQFVAIVKRACADRGVVVGESPVGVR